MKLLSLKTVAAAGALSNILSHILSHTLSRVRAQTVASTFAGFAFSALLHACLSLAMLAIPQASSAQEKVSFGTNWKAQGGHGGFYQALADGTYKRFGLDVDIVQGGPQVNNRPLLAAGKLDFLMAGNLLHSFDNVKNGIPTIAVAAFFQRDPQVFMAHEGSYKDFAALKTAKTILVGKDGQFSYWQWLKSEHGFKDEQLRPYTFNIAPFLQDKMLVQQGYASSEPFTARAQGANPKVFLLADYGWSTYSTTVETRTDLVSRKPEMVRKFVEASVIGWYNFIYGDRKLAVEAIKKVNPEMTDALISAEIEAFTKLNIIDSGDALTRGIGAMDMNQVQAFYDKMVKAGLYKPGEVDVKKAVTDQFVNKGAFLETKRKLGK
jgi:NitT/TauT family transport system substrate-binding protein